jgi:hypothetical protein
VQDALPVVQILLWQRNVEAIRVASSLNIGRGRALSQHLENGIAWDKVNQQKDQ